jgi:hypothetical protein
MVLAAIIINQAGKPSGLPSQSRDDLNLGTSVFLTNNNNTGVVSWLWEFVSRPVGSSAVISGSALPSASFVPDIRGSYLIKLTVDGSPSNPVTDTRIAAVKTSFFGLRKPATSEQKEFDPIEGWSSALQAMIDALDNDAALNLKRDGSNQPTVDIDWGGRKIIGLGGLQNEGALRLGEMSDPATASDKGFLYAKDDSGDTELFYKDSAGNILQISKAGRLNLADGYISFRYDELSPAFTTGGETLMALAAVPVETAAAHVFRNGALMRPVVALGPSKQEYILSGNQVLFQPSGSPGDWYSALYIDGYMLRGAGGTVKQNVAIAHNQSTNLSSDIVVGSFPIAAGDYQSMAIKFLATAFVTSGSLTGYVKLYNITDSVLVSSFTFTSVTTTEQISSVLTLPAAEKMYEVRISVTGGLSSSDRILCMWAGLQIG